jgi:hypothetical protein
LKRDLLQHVDEVIVPRLARGFARLVGRGQLRTRVLGGIGLAGTAAVLVVAVLATHHRQHGPGHPTVTGATVHVGVQQGQSIPGYISTSRAKLQTLVNKAEGGPLEVYALISLHGYLAPDRLTPVLGGVTVAEVYARVPLTQAQTQIVRIPAFRIPDDVHTGMDQVALRKEAEAEDLRQLAAKLSEISAAEGQLRTTYLSEAAVAVAEAEAYRSGCTCVYAAVVRATPVALDQISARPEVRAVDPAPEIIRLDQAVFLAPLPEQRDTVQPSPSSVASPTPTASASPSPMPTSPPQPSEPTTPTPTVGPGSVVPSRSIEPLR